jgi:hypothetical protein
MLLLFGVNAQAQHPPQNARTFNGTSDYYNLPLSVSTGFNGSKAVTIDYWFKVTSLQNTIGLKGIQPANIYTPTPLIATQLFSTLLKKMGNSLINLKKNLTKQILKKI